MDVDKLVPEAGNLEGFITQFPVFARAPNGVSKLREMILQLAITGRLTEQKDTDDFVIELLSDAKAKKKIYEQTLNIRKAKTISPLNDDDYPYLIPSHWVWCQLNDLACYIQRGKGPKYSENDSSLVVSQKCIQWSGFDISKARGIDESSLEKYGKERFIIEGDLLWNSTGTGTVGRVSIIENIDKKSIVVDSHVTVIRLSNIEPRYIWCCISSPWVQSRIEPDHENALVSGSTKQVELSTTAVKELPIALPPQEEQKRIVAKVDELMALCDKLEAQQQQQAHNVLRANTAAIYALLNPEPPQTEKTQKKAAIVSESEAQTQFEQNWQRIAQHFNTLYGCTLPMPDGEGRKKKHLVGLENVKALKAAIKQLGIMGTLIETFSIEGLALTELNVIKQEITELYKKRDIKKPKKINNCDELKSFSLPKSWEWIQLGEICHHVADGPHFSPKYVDNGTGVLFLSGRNIKENGIDFNTAKHISESDHLEFCKRVEPKNGDILYTKGGTTGIATVNRTDEKFSVWVHVAVLQFSQDKIYPEYIAMALNSPHCYSQSQLYTHGIGNKDLGLTRMVNITLPFPPYEEQKRIVAKVDQLMTLCDQLEQQLTQSYSDAEKLMQATVKALTA